MRFPVIFIALFSIAAGFAIAHTAFSAQLVSAGLKPEDFAPPETIFNYQPSPTGIVSLIGDFVWGLAMVIEWIGKTPQLLSQLLAALGVPPVISNTLILLATISFAAYVVYLIAGRVVFT